MGTKTISIKNKAYERLKNLKENEESFSDVILKLTNSTRNDFSDLVGSDAEISLEKLKKERKRDLEENRRGKVLSRQ